MRCAKQPFDIEAHDGRGHQAEIRQHGVPSADAWNAKRDLAKALALGDRFQRRAGIGDGDEVRASPVGANGPFCQFEEVCLQDIGLERAARLARHDEKRSGGINLAFDGSNLSRVGRVKHHELGGTVLAPECFGEHLRSEARSAHAEEKKMSEARPLNVVSETRQGAGPLVLLLDDVEPAKPFRLVCSGP